MAKDVDQSLNTFLKSKVWVIETIFVLRVCYALLRSHRGICPINSKSFCVNIIIICYFMFCIRLLKYSKASVHVKFRLSSRLFTLLLNCSNSFFNTNWLMLNSLLRATEGLPCTDATCFRYRVGFKSEYGQWGQNSVCYFYSCYIYNAKPI